MIIAGIFPASPSFRASLRLEKKQKRPQDRQMGFVLAFLISTFMVDLESRPNSTLTTVPPRDKAAQLASNEGPFDEGEPAMPPGAIEQIPSKPRARAKVKAFDPDAYLAKKERERKAAKATGEDLDFDALQAAYDKKQAQLSQAAEAAKAHPLPTVDPLDAWEAAEAAKAKQAAARQLAQVAATARPGTEAEDDAIEAALATREANAKAPFTLDKWINKHPYLALYFLGCLLAIALVLARIVLLSVIYWFTKENILAANLRKLDPPDQRSFGQKTWALTWEFVWVAALSWINVLFLLFQIPILLLRIAREAMTPVPQAVKMLRFPLRNNPHLSVEAVWAYLLAAGIHCGDEPPDQMGLLKRLDRVAKGQPDFDRTAALKHLERLDAVKADVLSAALASVSTRNGEE